MTSLTCVKERDVDLLLVDSGDLHDGTAPVTFPIPNLSADSSNRYRPFGWIPAWRHRRTRCICPSVSLISPSRSFDRAQSNQFFAQLPYDVLAIGKYASFPQNYLLCLELIHVWADSVMNCTSTRTRSTCTRTLPPSFPAGTSLRTSISLLRAQTAPQSACPSEVRSNFAMNPTSPDFMSCSQVVSLNSRRESEL